MIEAVTIDERPPVRADSKATHSAKAKPAKLSVSRKGAGTATQDPTTQNEDAAERELFGDEIHQLVADRQPIKLDPTIDDRARFRAQTQKLRQIGYQFDAKTQSWSYQT